MVAPGFGGKTTSPALETVRSHHLLHHPHHQTLLEPTELTSVPPSFVHRTALVCQTDIFSVLLDSPLEESLAALTGSHSVVLTGGIISTDSAEQRGRLVLEREVGLMTGCSTVAGMKGMIYVESRSMLMSF